MGYVELKNITKSYRGFTAVRNMNLSIEKGEFVSLLGPSGCGKTTTLRMIAGFVEPTDGEIFLQDRPVFSKAHGVSVPPEQRYIGMVFQSYALWPHMTVFDNIAYPLKLRRLGRREIAARVREAVDLVNLTGLEKGYPHELSGGQQQRVSIARAVVMEPSILLLDEPLSSLDAKLREKMCREINAIWRRTGITVVYVTHDQKEAMALSDTIVLMNRGEIVQSGSPSSLYEKPASIFSADFIGKANLLKGTAVPRAGILLEDGRLLPVESMEGAEGGKTGTFLFRPEQVRLVPAQGADDSSAPADGGLPGVVTYGNYYGSFMEYGVDIRCGAEIRAETDTHCKFKPGDPVLVTVRNVVAVQERED